MASQSAYRTAHARRPRRDAAEEPTSLATLFLLSPTIGTVVAAWRGVKLMITRWRERAVLERRTLSLRQTPAPLVHPACPECGFGTLRVVGDRVVRAQSFPARSFLAQSFRGQSFHSRSSGDWRQGWHHRALSPHDLRCDRPGCHHIAPREPPALAA